MPSIELRDSSHTANMTPREMTSKQTISAFLGTLASMQTANSATRTGMDARMIWAVQSDWSAGRQHVIRLVSRASACHPAAP